MPVPCRRIKPVAKIAGQPEEEAAAPDEKTAADAADPVSDEETTADAADPALPHAVRRPRRKKDDAEPKELFAFYEQSLF